LWEDTFQPVTRQLLATVADTQRLMGIDVTLCCADAAGWRDAVAIWGACTATRGWQPDTQPEPWRPAAYGACCSAAPWRLHLCNCSHAVHPLHAATGGGRHEGCSACCLLEPDTAVQAPHRRSTSFGGSGFALPGDPTDLLRSDLVTSKVILALCLLCLVALADAFCMPPSSALAL
jgi:hypothetical protein